MLSWICRLLLAFAAVAIATASRAQDMLDQVDLGSPAFTRAEMLRTELEAAIGNLAPGEVQLKNADRPFRN
jgi:hypothetical protein